MRQFSLLLIMALVVLASCSHKDEAIELSRDFFTSLSDTTNGGPDYYYPQYESLDVVNKSDMVDIDESEVYEKNDTFEVHCFNNYTDNLGKFKQDSIILFIAKDTTNELKIVDSRGLVQLDKDILGFGTAIGALNGKQINDVALSKKLSTIQLMAYEKYHEVQAFMNDKLKILNWSWETSYDGDAHGEARIVNNSDYILTGIKYHLIYYDSRGKFMAEDDGNVSKKLYPGEKYSFTFWSSNARYPTTANLSLQLTDDMIMEIIRNQDYTGKEYQQYIKKNKLK